MAAGTTGKADLIGVWARDACAMAEKHGREVLCTGKDLSPGMLGVTTVNRKGADRPIPI